MFSKIPHAAGHSNAKLVETLFGCVFSNEQVGIVILLLFVQEYLDSHAAFRFVFVRCRPGNKPYTWGVVAESNVLSVCMERMHRAFAELMVLAQRYDPAVTGPRRVRP